MVETFFGGNTSDLDAAVDGLLQGLVDNRKDLQCVIDALAGTLGAGISASDQQLTQVTARIKSAITRCLNLNAADLQKVTDAILSQLRIGTSENAAVLQTVASMLPQADMPLPPIYEGNPYVGGMPLPPAPIPSPPAYPPYPSPSTVPMPGTQPYPAPSPFPAPSPGTVPLPGTQPYPGFPPATSQPPPSGTPSPAPGASYGNDWVVDMLCTQERYAPRLRHDTIADGSVYTFDPTVDGKGPALYDEQAALTQAESWYQQNIPFITSLCNRSPSPVPPTPLPPAPIQPAPIPPVSYQPPTVGGMTLPPVRTPSPPLPMPAPIQQQPPTPAPGTPAPTVIPVPGGGGIVNVFVQPCCETTPAPTPATQVGGSAQEQPPIAKEPGHRVKGAADERPDDVAQGICAPAGEQFVIPTPGTPEWCRVQDGMIILLSKLGNQIIEWIGQSIQGTYDLVNQYANQPDPAFANPLEIGNGLFTIIARGLAKLAKPMLQSLWNYYCSIKRGIGKIGTCKTETIIGLYTVKAAITILKNTRLGWDGLAWLTVDIAFTMPSFERAVEYICNAACPYEIPSVSEADEAWIHNTIDDETYRCWVKAHGVDPAVHTPILLAKRDKASVEQVIEYGRRVGWDENTIRQAMRFLGWVVDEEAKQQQYLYDELPTISDHLHWLQRNAFDNEYIKDFNLLDGFDTDAEINKLEGMDGYKTRFPTGGRNFWQAFGADLYAQGMLKKYGALHYAAHWINPSPGQLFEMLRRLRPGRVDKSIEFTEKDLLRLLAEQDVAPYFRARMRAIAYQPFGLRFLRQLYDTRQIDDSELIQRLQDISYSEADATILQKSESIRRARTVATGTRGYTVPTIKALYLGNKIRQNVVIDRMKTLGYERQEALDAMQAWRDIEALKHDDAGAKSARNELLRGVKEGLIVGVLSQDDAVNTLAANGYSRDNAKAYVISIVTNDRIALTKKGILQIKKGVMSGRLSLEGARPLLLHLGITPDKAQEYLNVWQYDLEAGKRVLSKAEIIRLTIEGLLPLAVARQRLLNLNYEDADTILIAAEAQLRINEAEQKVIQQEQKTASVQARAIASAIKQNQAQLERFRKRLYQLGTVKNIGTWYKDGLVGEQWVRERMTLLGIIQGDIDLMILEWNQERNKSNAKK